MRWHCQNMRLVCVATSLQTIRAVLLNVAGAGRGAEAGCCPPPRDLTRFLDRLTPPPTQVTCGEAPCPTTTASSRFHRQADARAELRLSKKVPTVDPTVRGVINYQLKFQLLERRLHLDKLLHREAAPGARSSRA